MISSLSDVISGMKRCGRVEDSTRESFTKAAAISFSSPQLSPEIIPSLPDACAAAQGLASNADEVHYSFLRDCKVKITPCTALKISQTTSTSLKQEDCTIDQESDGNNSHIHKLGIGTKEPSALISASRQTMEHKVDRVPHKECKIDVHVTPPKGSTVEVGGLSPSMSSRGCADEQTAFSCNGNSNVSLSMPGGQTFSLSPPKQCSGVQTSPPKKCIGDQIPFSPSKGNVSSQDPSLSSSKQCPSDKSSDQQLLLHPLRYPSGPLEGSASNQTPSNECISNQRFPVFKREVPFNGGHPKPKKIKLDTPFIARASSAILGHYTEDVENGSRNIEEEGDGTRNVDEVCDSRMGEDADHRNSGGSKKLALNVVEYSARNTENNVHTELLEEMKFHAEPTPDTVITTCDCSQRTGVCPEGGSGVQSSDLVADEGTRKLEIKTKDTGMESTETRGLLKPKTEAGKMCTTAGEVGEAREVQLTEEECSAKEEGAEGGGEKVWPIETGEVRSEEGVAEECPTKEGEEAICPTTDQAVKEDEGEMLSPLFSPEFGDGHDMLSTQMNRQINRVETFLKMDRLRRQRSTK